MSLTIWCNAVFAEADKQLLIEGTRSHKLVFARSASASVLDAGKADLDLPNADVAFGQPDAGQCLALPRLRWVEVTTAGYTRYDTPEFQEGFRARGAAFSNVSDVFADPCAQHVLAMMLALGRRLLPSHRDQLTTRAWGYVERRYESRLLTGQNVLLLGYGAIGRRLMELLAPFGMNLSAVRRQIRSERGIRIIPEEAVSSALAAADHVVNILPDNASTRNYVNARRLACIKPGTRFYNVGRGTTVDERALLEALRSGRISEAYLDVFETEPLPVDHPFWSQPNCYVTPHTAGGRHDQDTAIVKHFLRNLAAFESGGPMIDRVV
ncbi:D-2-hydroxyacid dehydrogenase [Horticoccus sp. 23ND18S-11]|uniref:D-2-hydroxyacid dehydrogenase n=1 Tax=Horticoccus sp. 23ND18S-11 TaxID=3391832 RepID=UPI0039C9DFD9